MKGLVFRKVVVCIPANSSALDGYGDFALSQRLTALDLLQRRRGIGEPEIVIRVRVDTNVGL